MWALSSLAFRTFTSNWLRSGILIAAVLLGIAAVSAVQLTNDAMTRGVDRAWRATVGVSHAQIQSISGAGFSETDLAAVRALPDVVAVAPVARKWVFFRTPGDRGFVEIIGVDPSVEPRVRSYQLQQGIFLGNERPHGVVTRASWAQEHGLHVGDSFQLITFEGLRDFQLVGVLGPEAAGLATYGSVVLISLETARNQFGLLAPLSPPSGGPDSAFEVRGAPPATPQATLIHTGLTAISLVLSSEAALPLVQEGLGRVIPEDYVFRRPDDSRAALQQSIADLELSLTLFGATALFVALFLIFNTMEMTISSQMQQTGRLRAAGATQRQIFLLFLVQGLIPGAIGALAGAVGGFALAQGLAAWIGQSQNVAVAEIAFSLPTMVISFGIGLVAVVLGSAVPALQAARLNPIEAIQGGGRDASQLSWLPIGIGVVFAAPALLALLLPVGDAIGLALKSAALLVLLLGLVLMSRATIRPLGLAFGLPFRWMGGISGRLAARNLTRDLGRTTATVAGFMVSLSLLIALVSLTLSSIRAGERWTLSLVPGDYVVVAPVDQPTVFVAQFANLPGVQYASPVSFFSTEAGGSILQVAGIDPEKFTPGLDFVEGSADEALAGLQAGGSVIVPNRLARERGLATGGVLQLRTRAGLTPFRIAGVIAHSFPSADGASTLLISGADAERLFDVQNFRLLMVKSAASADPVGTRAGVDELAERYGMSATTAQEISTQVALALWHLLALMGALVGIGLLIGAFGTANTMLMNIAERFRELSILWAGGMSRTQLQMMTVVEAMMMGLIGGVLGSVAGGLISRLLVSLSQTSGFQPEYVFPFPAAVAGIAATMVAAVAAAIIPARRAAQLDWQ
ncbi:MAG TPA: FtsX-like permease family protein [Chloroflexota bacterium]